MKPKLLVWLPVLAFCASIFFGNSAYGKSTNLTWSTFLGGAANDTGYTIDIDSAGSVYVSGETMSSDFPATSGAYDESYHFAFDVFVGKLNSTGSTLIYATFLGGNMNECGKDIAVDSSGRAWVSGNTDSADFPTTSGALDESHNGLPDAFISCLNSSGTGLTYSTFLGSSGSDWGNAIAVDFSGYVYVAGYTNSTGFPTTSGAFDESHNGDMDVFVSKLNSAGTTLEYSTFLGGGAEDDGYALAVDSSGCCYVTGATLSSGFPVTSGAFDTTYGTIDGFVSKLNSSGTALEYSTFIGGSGLDIFYAISVDSSGCVYVTGKTQSSNYPVTSGAFDESYSKLYDVIITKLNGSGSALDYSTYLGGSGADVGWGIVTDTSGCAYVTGRSESGTFPTTSGAFDESGPGVFVTKMRPAGWGLVYSTFLGDGTGYGLTFDAGGCAYVTGVTQSSSFPTTSGVFDTTHNGGNDTFVAKIEPVNYLPAADAGSDQWGYVDEVLTLDGSGSSDPDDDPLTFTWEFGDGSTGDGETVTHSYTATGVYTVTLTVDDGEDSDIDTCVVEVLASGQPRADAGPDQEVYVHGVVTFDGSGSSDPDDDPLTYTWEFGDGGTASGVTVTYVYDTAGIYTATLTVSDGTQSDEDTCIVTVVNRAPVADAGPDQMVYADSVVTFDGSGSYDPDNDPLAYLWEFGDGATGTGETVTHIYTAVSSYTVTLTVNDGGYSDDDICQIEVMDPGQPFADAGPDQEVLVEEIVTFDGSGSFDPDGDPLTYSWNFGEGSSASGMTVTHTYYAPGAYAVGLTVSDGELSDADGCVVIVGKPSGDIYFVAPDGDDGDPGTYYAPWATPEKAAATLAAGDTVYIRGGTYPISAGLTPAGSGAPGAYITFAGFQNEEVILDAGGDSPVFSLDSSHSYIRFVGLTLQNGNYSAIHITRDSSTSDPPERIEIINCTLKTCAGSCVKVFAAHDVIFAGDIFRDSKEGIELSVNNKGNTYNIQIIDCEMSGMSRDGVVAKAQRSGLDWIYWSENVHIAGSEVYDCLDDGFDCFGRYFTLEYCVAHDIDASEIPPSNGTQFDEDGHGFKLYALDIPVDEGRYHGDYTRCLTYNINREGYKLSCLTMEDSSVNVKKIRLRNCTSAVNDYGVLVVTDSFHPMDVEIKNCLVDTRNLDPDDPYYGDDLSRAQHITGDPVIWGEGPLGVPDFSGYFFPDFDYNLWYSQDENGSLLEPIDFIGTLFTGAEVNDGTYYTETGCGEHSISYDPVFVDENGCDYHLDENSPAIDAGTDIGLPYAGSAPDLGVYESGTVVVTSPGNYLSAGENWISIPVAPENPGPYAVFSDLGYWPNCVYHNLYRYGLIGGAVLGFISYPTYQAYSFEFGNINPGIGYKLMLAGAQAPITVSGVELKEDQTVHIPGSGSRYFYFGCPFNAVVPWSSCQIDNGGTVVSVAQAISNGWISSDVRHFSPETRDWEPIGTYLEPWHAYRLSALTGGAIDLIIPYDVSHDISGTVILEYPGTTQGSAAIDYQVREPGLPPTGPIYQDTLTVSLTPGNPASGNFTISSVANGSYDVALKHANHIADMVQDVVVSGADVTGLEFVLWAGDADGDDNSATAYPDDAGGDNDVELNDYYTLFYQYQGGVPVTTGYNSDFDADGDIDLADYYGLYYGYQNAAAPGNWY